MDQDTAAGNSTPAVSTTPKHKAKSAAKKPKVSEMVNDALASLEESGGTSLQAIKKHIGSHHKVDLDRLTPFIKKYLKSAVASGALIQTKGKGASGSFKLSASGPKTKEPSKAKKTKEEGASSQKAKTAAKKVTKPKTPKDIHPKEISISSLIFHRLPKDQSLFLYLYPIYYANKKNA